jgi:hypothetical protein
VSNGYERLRLSLIAVMPGHVVPGSGARGDDWLRSLGPNGMRGSGENAIGETVQRSFCCVSRGPA